MEKLTKISIIISFLGIIILLFLTTNIDFSLRGINNMTEEGKDVTIIGKVINQQTYGNTTILSIKTDCTLQAVSYNNNLEYLTNKEITIKGTTKEVFSPELYVNKITIN